MINVSKEQFWVRVAGLVFLLLSSLTHAPAEQAVTNEPTKSVSIPLEVAAGTPLRLYLVKRVWFRHGEPVTAQVIDPVWAYDRVVIPAGTMVQGTVSSLQKVSPLARARAMVGGDFTPLKRAELSFSNLDFADGRRVGISVTPALGLDTIYIPKRINSNTSAQHPATLKGKLGQQVKQEYQARRDAAIYFVRGQSKKEWVEEWLLSKLPYHPQLYRTRTRVDVFLAQPLEFGPATMQGDLSKGLGQLQPAQELAEVRLLTTVTSAKAHNGESLSGILTTPVFGSDHTLLLPVGTSFTGKVTLSQRARWFHRGGKLRFEFDHVELPASAGLTQQPNERFIQGQLAAIETNPAAVHVDSEGTAKATESKTRFIRPVIAGLVAAHSADDDRDRSSSIGGAGNAAANPNLSGRALGGFSGFGILGTAASFGPRGIGAALGYYGLAWSVYSNVLARGKELVFDKNTAMEIRFSPDARHK